MDKPNLELFKQVLDEAVSSQFDDLAASCDEEIVCTKKHKLAMRTIIYGKAEGARVRTPLIRRMLAVIIIAALLLTGCAVVFRNEIREAFEEFFVWLTYDNTDDASETIENIYILGYVPEGYVLEKERITAVYVRYEYWGNNGETLYFEQHAQMFSGYYIDSESGYSKIEEIEDYEVYYRFTNKYHHYVCQISNNSVTVKSSVQLSNEEVNAMLDGITIK